MQDSFQKEILLNTLNKLSQSSVVTKKTKNLIEDSTSHLVKLYTTDISKEFTVPKQALSETYKVLKEHYHEKSQATTNFFSKRRNIKKLIVALNMEFENERLKIIDSQYYSLALEIIFTRGKFKKSFFPILIKKVFESWDNYNIGNIIENLVILVKEDGEANHVSANPSLKYILIQDSFSSMLSDIIANKISLDINSNYERNIFHFLGVGPYFGNTIFFQSFYIYMVADVVRKGLDVNSFYEIESTLKKLQKKDLSKRIIPIMIKYVENKNEIELREKLINLSYQMIGDPGIDVYWAGISSGEDSELNLLKKAQQILKRWLTNKFLTVFFNNLSSNTDDDRKDFWLKYVDSVIDFKILTMEKNYNYLVKLMTGIPTEYVKSKISIVANNSKYIFILKFRNKTIIEFSTTGNAALVYDNKHYDCPNLNNKKFNFNDFKMTNYSSLIFQRSGYQMYNIKKTGRLFHNEGWELFMDEWIENNLRLS